VVNVSVTGPGKPYCRIPVGLTGAPRAEIGIEGIGAGTGRPGDVRVDEGGSVLLGVDVSGLDREDEKISAVRAAPAPADVAAMIARVVFDIIGSDQMFRRQRIRRVKIGF
jgi:hypothetical protein